MTVSATTAFNLDLLDIVDEAYERCGVEGSRTGFELRTARRSMGLLLLEWASRGLNLWTVDSGVQALTANVGEYTMPADTIDLIEHVIRQNGTDLAITRIPVGTYATIPNKTVVGRPCQIYVDRQRDAPIVKLWPLPQDNTYSLVYWRLRRLKDAGTNVETQDVPFRFLPCFIAGLAYFLSIKTPSAIDRVPMLKAQYDEAWQVASEEDRDRSSFFVSPMIAYR